MKQIVFSPSLEKTFKLLAKKRPAQLGKIKKQLLLFEQNPKHPSLRLHKLKGALRNVWSISIDESHRLIYLDEIEYYFFDFGTHDQVYRSP